MTRCKVVIDQLTVLKILGLENMPFQFSATALVFNRDTFYKLAAFVVAYADVSRVCWSRKDMLHHFQDSAAHSSFHGNTS